MITIIIYVVCHSYYVFLFRENRLIVEDCQEVVQNLLQESLTDSLLEYTQEVSILSFAINSLLENSPLQFDLVCLRKNNFYLILVNNYLFIFHLGK